MEPTRSFDDVTKVVYGLPFPIVNLILPEEGIIEVVIETEKGTIRAGRLRVHISDQTGTVPL